MKPTIEIQRDPNEKQKVMLYNLASGECFRFVNWVDPQYFYMRTPRGYVALNSGEYFDEGYGPKTREVQRIQVSINADMRMTNGQG